MSHHRNMYHIKSTSKQKYSKDRWRLTSWRRYRSTLLGLWVMAVEPTWIFRRFELWDGFFFCWAFLPSVVQHYHLREKGIGLLCLAYGSWLLSPLEYLDDPLSFGMGFFLLGFSSKCSTTLSSILQLTSTSNLQLQFKFTIKSRKCPSL